mgnify:FL=1|tara:strand:- start:73 stop:474 length:402 start_codon:yes stop_codon:yes gene_type:complete
MIFSGGIESYRCNGCKAEVQNTLPTSIAPIFLTCGLAGQCWSNFFTQLFGHHWFLHILSFALAFLTLWLMYELIERTTNRAVRAKRCPKCGESLEHVGSGFYDSWIPNPYELLIYALTICLPVLAACVVSVFI